MICPICPPEVQGKITMIVGLIAAAILLSLTWAWATYLHDMAHTKNNPQKRKELKDHLPWIVIPTALFAIAGISVLTGPVAQAGTWFYNWFSKL